MARLKTKAYSSANIWAEKPYVDITLYGEDTSIVVDLSVKEAKVLLKSLEESLKLIKENK